MSKMKALVCRECGKEYPPKAIHVCEMCFGPLEVKYNYDEIKSTISRKKIEQGPNSMWRYIDLLPVESTAIIGPHAGLTPLVRAKIVGTIFSPVSPSRILKFLKPLRHKARQGLWPPAVAMFSDF